jgi:hypothetical protein
VVFLRLKASRRTSPKTPAAMIIGIIINPPYSVEKLALIVFGEFIVKLMSPDPEFTSPDHPENEYFPPKRPKGHNIETEFKL